MTKLFTLSIFLVSTITSNISFAQKYQKDVQSIESIMAAVTEVISGSADQERDWERFKHLFSEDAKLIPTQKTDAGEVLYNYWTPQEYVDMYKKNRDGTAFYEQELFRITESFGSIAHCFSTYSVRTEEDGEVERRGINSIQLLKTKDRWYIMNIFWSNESQDERLPENTFLSK